MHGRKKDFTRQNIFFDKKKNQDYAACRGDLKELEESNRLLEGRNIMIIRKEKI